MNRSLICAICLGTLLVAGKTTAQSLDPLTPGEAVELAIQNSPQVRASKLTTKKAVLLVEQEEYRYIPTLSADAGVRYGRSVSLSPNGARLIESNSIVLATGISHTLPIGTVLSADIEVGRTYRDSVELGDLGAAYDTAVNVQVTQPLLRGFGGDLGRANLRQAELQEKVVDAQETALLNSIVLDTLESYWSLWSAERGLEIQKSALEIAKKQLAEAEIRMGAGDMAPAQLVPLRIQVAQAEEAMVTQEAQIRQLSIALAERLGVGTNESIRTDAAGPKQTVTLSLEEATELALNESPSISQIKANIGATKIRTEVAQNNALPRLDALASVNVAGLGTTPSDSLSSFGSLDAVVLYGGLRLELPVINRARRIEVERSEADTIIAETELELAERALKAEVASLLVNLQTAQQRLELARDTAELARENVEAQNARFEAGRGTMLEVVDSVESVREAEFRVVQIEIQIAQERLKLDELTGRLTENWR